MALNIKNLEVERLAAEVAELAGETKTEAIRRSLAERKERLLIRSGGLSRRERLERLLQDQIWPQVRKPVRGKKISKGETRKDPGLRTARLLSRARPKKPRPPRGKRGLTSKPDRR